MNEKHTAKDFSYFFRIKDVEELEAKTKARSSWVCLKASKIYPTFYFSFSHFTGLDLHSKVILSCNTTALSHAYVGNKFFLFKKSREECKLKKKKKYIYK